MSATPTSNPVSWADICTTDMDPYYAKLKELTNRQVISLKEVENTPQVALCDEDDDLAMYCYSQNTNEKSEESTKDCRGLVFEKKTGTLVSRAFGYTPSYTNKTLPADVREYITDNFSGCKFFPSLEGSLIRVFNYNGKWYLSTHRKLDAFRSSWGCRTSFGQFFVNGLKGLIGHSDDALPRFLSTLDAETQYVFLVSSSEENRIACSPNPTVLYVGTLKDGIQVANDPNLVIPQQEEMTFTTLDFVNAWVDIEFKNTSDGLPCFQGVVAYLPNGKQVKICSETYTNLANLRGNVPSIMFRYLQIRTDPEMNQKYRTLYPSYSQRFDGYEFNIKAVANEIYATYLMKFVRRQEIPEMPQEEYHILSAVHGWYKSQDPATRRRVAVEDVLNVMNAAKPTHLNHMLHRFTEAEKRSLTQ